MSSPMVDGSSYRNKAGSAGLAVDMATPSGRGPTALNIDDRTTYAGLTARRASHSRFSVWPNWRSRTPRRFPNNLRGPAGFVDHRSVERADDDGILVLHCDESGKMRLGAFSPLPKRRHAAGSTRRERPWCCYWATEQTSQRAMMAMRLLSLAMSYRQKLMRIVTRKPLFRSAVFAAVAVVAALGSPRPADALVVENMAGTTVAPADDPGWNNTTVSGSLEYIYLGDAWVLSARHVGVPSSGQTLSFAGGSFGAIPGQNFIVPNPAGLGYTAETDLRLLRIKGEPTGVSPICTGSANCLIAATPPPLNGEVVIVGHGRTRAANQTHWNSSWVEVTSGWTYTGYKAMDPDDDTKRWGTNRLANANNFSNTFSQILSTTTGILPLTTPDHVTRDVASIVTSFDASGLLNEAQAVANDSGSSVFHSATAPRGSWSAS